MKRLTLLLALLCAACSTTAPPSGPSLTVSSAGVTTTPAPAPAPPSTPLARLQSFTLADLQAASADAKAQTPPDTTSSQCYDYLIKILPTIQTPSGVNQVGAILAFQKLRDLQNGVASQNGVLKSLNLACAPLAIDVQTTINRLALIGAGGVAAGGAALPLLAPLP